MHELSIALSLVDSIEQQASRRGIERVDAVRVRIGAMSTVVSDALRFAWDLAAEGSVAQGARLDIEIVPVVVYCPACAAERTIEGPIVLQCPTCGAPTPDVRAGRELQLSAVEVSSG